MSYRLRCADTGADCPAEFTTRSEEELLEHVKLHASSEHPDLTLDEATVAQVKGAVQQV